MESNFKVVEITKANKPKYYVAKVIYDGNPKEYTYVRRGHDYKGKTEKDIVVSGTKVFFDLCFDPQTRLQYKVLRYEKCYETKGNKIESFVGSTSEKIKKEVEENDIEVPEVEINTEDFEEEEPKHEKYNQIKTCLECKIPVYLAGPAGSGKNYTVEQICDELGWNFYFSNAVQQEYKLTGFIDAGGKYHETEFYKACTDEEECVFFLDELDASIPDVLVLLNAAIANGYFEFPNGRVTLDKVHFVAAGNTVGSGADELYTGRSVIDASTLDRFVIIDFGYSRNIERYLAKGNMKLVNFIEDLRKVSDNVGVRTTFSYRCIKSVTALEMTKTLKLYEILKIAVVKGLDKDTIISLKGGLKTERAFGKTDKYTDALVKLCEMLQKGQQV